MRQFQAMAATIVGAVIGGVAGYLFFTDEGAGCAGRSSRRSTTSRASSTASARPSTRPRASPARDGSC